MRSIHTIVELARQAKSLMHHNEMEWLCTLARSAPDGVGVEIGVYAGASLSAWVLAREGRGEAYGVDDWSYKDIPDLRRKCLDHLEHLGVQATLLSMRSQQAAEEIQLPVAFCLIDGDHSQLSVEQDLQLWGIKVQQGGILALHDYGRHRNGCCVTEAVDAWHRLTHGEWIRLGCETTLIAFKRLVPSLA